MPRTLVIPSEIHPDIAALDLDKIKHRLALLDYSLTLEVIDETEKGYKKFLNVIKANPGIEVYPSKLVEQFWQQHILDTTSYNRHCQKILGYYLHYFPDFGLYGRWPRFVLGEDLEEVHYLHLDNWD